MIDLNKTYKTRSGCPVWLFTDQGGEPFSFIGAIWLSGVWQPREWTKEGRANIQHGCNQDELVEVTLADELNPLIPWEALRPEIVAVAMNSTGFWRGFRATDVEEMADGWACASYSTAFSSISFDLGSVNMPDVDPLRWRETLCIRPEGR